MAPGDAEKTAFRTPLDNFHYTVMPFGLQNSGARYQRAMTTIFHDMLHKELEDYVDDIVFKSKRRKDHSDTLRKVFQRCRASNLKIHPLKCAFGVPAGKKRAFYLPPNPIHQYHLWIQGAEITKERISCWLGRDLF